jgi:hypothetical protein
MFLRFHWQVRSFSRNHGRITEGALERSLRTNLREIRSLVSTSLLNNFPAFSYSFQRTGPFDIVTLDPNKFAEKNQRCLLIGNQEAFAPRISLLKQSRLATFYRLHYDRTCKTSTELRPLYPPDTKAFLYYSVSPERPRIAGELRLRVTSSNDPASFENGSDLLRLDGQPWSRPLYSLSKLYFSLYEKLREDRLVLDDLDTALAALPSKIYRYNQSHILYTLNDTFIIDFSSSATTLLVITEQGGMQSLKFDRTFSDGRHKCGGRPYTGAYTNHHLFVLLY